MPVSSPVYTTENTCQDCYKCVRHCPCRAIRVDNGSASVIPELCVACGRCVSVCPAKAKKIRSDFPRVKYLLESGKKVYASLAPSFRSYFRRYKPESFAAAVKRLGFAGVSETALGAQFVSAETAEYLKKAPNGLYISSACPASVDYIRKYVPQYTENIVPVHSPVLAHCRFLRETCGSGIGIVFFGPCAAKKNEAESHPDLLDLAVTFSELENIFEAENIDPGSISETDSESLFPFPAEEGTVYAVEGGMNDTIRDHSANVRYIAVSGLQNVERFFEKTPDADLLKRNKVFVECLACSGGCINGPSMPRTEAGTLTAALQIVKDYRGETSVGREVNVNMKEQFLPDPPKETGITENAVKDALAMVGKTSFADELNCGGCGYYTCREFAKALVAGKAETDMCVSYMRQLAQRKSNALIKYIPAGVVIVNRDLTVLECNRRFVELFDEYMIAAFEVCGLVGADLRKFIDFGDLITSILEGGSELQRSHYVFGDKVLSISIFSVTPNQCAGVIIQDVTSMELRREQVSEKARAVIQKNIITCQQIARSLGEHMADTEILLREVAGSYSKAGGE